MGATCSTQGKSRNICRSFGFNTIHKDGKISNNCENIMKLKNKKKKCV